MNGGNHARAAEQSPAVVYRDATLRARPAERAVDVIASTGAVDGHGTRIEGPWQLDRFKANPVVLFSHDSRDLPIGRATRVEERAEQLEASIQFVSAEMNPRAEQVRKQVEAGFIRGVSVGFRPHSARFELDNDREILVLSQPELFEISFTAVPSNPEALVQLRAMAGAKRRPEMQQSTKRWEDYTRAELNALRADDLPHYFRVLEEHEQRTGRRLGNPFHRIVEARKWAEHKRLRADAEARKR